MTTLWQIGLGSLFFYALPHLGHLIVAVLYVFDIRKYILVGDATRRVCQLLQKDCHSSALKNLNGKEVLSGYFVGLRCLGYIDNQTSCTDTIHLLCSPWYYQFLTNDVVVLSDGPRAKGPIETIRVFTRMGSYSNFFYRSMRLDVSHIKPLGLQIPIVEQILQVFSQKGRATIFLHGVSGAGKSSVGYLVAKSLQASFCHTFQPTDPGDSFSSLVQDTHCEEPLVVVLEEVDTIVQAIHRKSIVPNAKVPTSVKDKASWSTLLDDMIFYKNVVLIMTSNQSKDSLDALDPSYLRQGRIDLACAMLEPLQLPP